MQIKDKVIIITGASAGIGRATAKLLSHAGAKVVLASRSEDKIQELAKELPGSIAVRTDMTLEDDVENLIAETMSEFGRIDVLVNNAGQGIYGGVENTDIEDYRKIFELNVVGPLRAMQNVIPIMRKQGSGTILNISSMVSKANYPYLGAYASTKYALNALSLALREELAKAGIVVSIMLPGMTQTDFGKNAIKSDDVAKMMESRTREGMPASDSPEYVAERIKIAIEEGWAETLAHDPAEF